MFLNVRVSVSEREKDNNMGEIIREGKKRWKHPDKLSLYTGSRRTYRYKIKKKKRLTETESE